MNGLILSMFFHDLFVPWLVWWVHPDVIYPSPLLCQTPAYGKPPTESVHSSAKGAIWGIFHCFAPINEWLFLFVYVY